ncbi:hypothetical protein ACRAWG_36005 [Methylobacterium sp. P31]
MQVILTEFCCSSTSGRCTPQAERCGALMIAAAPVFGAEATRVLFERTSAYRNLPGHEWGVPVWEFAARGG